MSQGKGTYPCWHLQFLPNVKPVLVRSQPFSTFHPLLSLSPNLQAESHTPGGWQQSQARKGRCPLQRTVGLVNFCHQIPIGYIWKWIGMGCFPTKEKEIKFAIRLNLLGRLGFPEILAGISTLVSAAETHSNFSLISWSKKKKKKLVSIAAPSKWKWGAKIFCQQVEEGIQRARNAGVNLLSGICQPPANSVF